MRKKTTRLPRYRGVLDIEGGFWSATPEDCLEYVDDLARHYLIFAPWRDGEGDSIWDTPRSINDPTLSDAEQLDTWRRLAIAIASDIVPAFRERKKGGRPRKFVLLEVQRRAHAARLVEIVAALQAKRRQEGLPASRVDAFREIVKYLKVYPHPRWLYGSLRKATGFVQAWKAIPKDIIAKPAKYLNDNPVDKTEFARIWNTLPEERARPELFEVALDFAEENRRRFLAALPQVSRVLKPDKR